MVTDRYGADLDVAKTRYGEFYLCRSATLSVGVLRNAAETRFGMFKIPLKPFSHDVECSACLRFGYSRCEVLNGPEVRCGVFALHKNG